MPIPDAARADHERWLFELTQTPTAAGREYRVVRWIERWVAERPDLALTADPSGNLVVSVQGEVHPPAPGARPIWITAHLDHPAFVVERIVGPATVLLSFRGGVMDDYFVDGDVVIHDCAEARHRARLCGKAEGPCAAFTYFMADSEHDFAADVRPGNVAVWDLPEAFERDGNIYTHACDDLAAVAAALSAMDMLRRMPAGPGGHPKLLFTRAEEIGFIGAIAACRHGTLPKSARVINLENSRSFEDSPIGGGPIVRVGDRLSVFSPNLTAAVAKCAENLAGGAASPTASQKNSDINKSWRWQRKLMAGGACESTVFCAAGYEATCVCLPLGNYHNMADLAAVQAGTNTTPPRVGPEFVSLSDYRGLVDLLVACGTGLPEAGPVTERIEKLWAERAFVLDEM
jgi:putative aminopeptidase FrvX